MLYRETAAKGGLGHHPPDPGIEVAAQFNHLIDKVVHNADINFAKIDSCQLNGQTRPVDQLRVNELVRSLQSNPPISPTAVLCWIDGSMNFPS
jgi:hypothetical protein